VRWCREYYPYVYPFLKRSGRRRGRSRMELGLCGVFGGRESKGKGRKLTHEQINRAFDPYDILANVLGSLLALGLCNFYHKRMLERKRAARGYTAVAGDIDEERSDLDRDIELGETVGDIGQESGATVDEELERWDENAEDWESTEPEPVPVVGKKSLDGDGDLGEGKKRND
jgi:hypothetical protein